MPTPTPIDDPVCPTGGIRDSQDRSRDKAIHLHAVEKRITDFEKQSDRIVLKVINTESYKGRLPKIPHRKLQDLSIIYLIHLTPDDFRAGLELGSRQDYGSVQAFCIISNELMDSWNMTEEKLYALALRNMQKLMPASILPLEQLLWECRSSRESDPGCYPLITPNSNVKNFPDVTANPKSEIFPDVAANPKSEIFPDITANPKSEIFPDITANPKSETFPDPLDDSVHSLMSASPSSLSSDAPYLPPIYVATNQDRINGFSVLLYPGILESLQKRMGDYYIIPSSIHEALIIPRKMDIPPMELCEMVREINQTEVAPQERLSDNIYYYDQTTRQISAWIPAEIPYYPIDRNNE